MESLQDEAAMLAQVPWSEEEERESKAEAS
jgi:hypothetical protein